MFLDVSIALKHPGERYAFRVDGINKSAKIGREIEIDIPAV